MNTVVFDACVSCKAVASLKGHHVNCVYNKIYANAMAVLGRVVMAVLGRWSDMLTQCVLVTGSLNIATPPDPGHYCAEQL